MKLSGIYLGIAVAAIAGVSYWIYFSPEGEKEPAYSPRQKSSIRHARDWNRAAEYYRSIRANINTGKVEIEDVLKAREEVLKHSLKKSGSLNLQWKERGPNNVGGRTRSILVDKNNSNHVFAGSVSGGLFVSNNAGSSWQPVNDQFENLIVSSLTQAPDGNIWMGTGSDFDYSANQEGILFPGNGLYKSTNGGSSFTRIVGPSIPNNPFDTTTSPISNTIEWSSINRIAFKPGNSSEIYVAMNKGLRVSNDGGQNWINPMYANVTACSGPAQVVRGEDLDVTTDGRLFVSIDGQIYYSDNPMVCSSYVKVTAVPKGKRTEIATAPSNPNYVYALTVENAGHFSGVYKSTDKGVTWTKILFPIDNYFEPMSNEGLGYGQGVYDLAFSVAPDNANKIFIGGVQLWKYDGNLTRIADEFSNFPPYYVHADKHVFTFDPSDPNTMYIGTDGGVFKSFDQGNNFFAANKGYNVTQFYAMAYNNPSAGVPTILLGGSQDNGSQMMKGTGVDPLQADEVMGGDGFDCDISSITGTMFATIYSDLLSRSTGPESPFAPICGEFCGSSVFHTVTRLWESKTDITSQDSILFTVDTTKQGIGTGNGNKKVFTGTLTPLQSSAKLVIGSLRIQVGTSGFTFNDGANSTNSPSTFISGGNSCTIDYNTGAFSVTLASAPSVNTSVWAYFTTRYDAGSTLMLLSNTGGVPVYHTLAQNMSYGDSIMVQDPVQSIVALGVPSNMGGVAITRKGLDFNATVDDTWIKLNTTGTPSCIEFSKDGNHMFIGVDGTGVFRISGLNSVYKAADLNAVTRTKIFAKNYAVTGIAVDSDNPDKVVVTLGNYGHADYVYTSTSATTAPATTGNGTFVNSTGDLPPMPVYDAEFLNHSSKVVLGTEFGIYSTLNIFANPVQWTDENNGAFPHMPVFEVRQQKFWPSNNYEMLFIGTHGRGMWESGSLVTGIKELPENNGDRSRFISDLTVYPNPLKETGFLVFDLPSAVAGNIRIYDLNGRVVRSILKQAFSPGTNKVKLDTEKLPAGTYFVTVEAGSISSAAKFVIIK